MLVDIYIFLANLSNFLEKLKYIRFVFYVFALCLLLYFFFQTLEFLCSYFELLASDMLLLSHGVLISEEIFILLAFLFFLDFFGIRIVHLLYENFDYYISLMYFSTMLFLFKFFFLNLSVYLTFSFYQLNGFLIFFKMLKVSMFFYVSRMLKDRLLDFLRFVFEIYNNLVLNTFVVVQSRLNCLLLAKFLVAFREHVGRSVSKIYGIKAMKISRKVIWKRIFGCWRVKNFLFKALGIVFSFYLIRNRKLKSKKLLRATIANAIFYRFKHYFFLRLSI